MSVPEKNGFRINSWTDVASIAAMFAMLLAGLAWGLKLDGRTTGQAERITRLEQKTDALPVIEERLRRLEQQAQLIDDEHTRWEREHERIK